MQTRMKSIFAVTFTAMMLVSVIGCKKEVEKVAPQLQTSEAASTRVAATNTLTNTTLAAADFTKLANIIRDSLKDRMGASVVISYNGVYKTSTSLGFSRMAQDAPSRAMTIFDRFTIGDVSATISATALMKAFSVKPEGLQLLNSPIWPYLPKHWTLGPYVKNITFKDLLTHKSGLHSTFRKDDYQTLKKLIIDGVNLSYKGKVEYSTGNYGLLRIILPVLTNYPIKQVNQIIPSLTDEITQAGQLAQAYKDYCRKAVFEKLGSCGGQVIDCVNKVDVYPGLFYFPGKPTEKGKLAPDMTIHAGGQGWVLNNAQLADFFRTLHFTETLIPKSYSDYMRLYLIGFSASRFTDKGHCYVFQDGYFDDWLSEVNTLLIGFNDGVQITVVVNARDTETRRQVIQAYDAWRS